MTCLEYLNEEILKEGFGSVRYTEEECQDLIIESHRYIRENALKLNRFRRNLTKWQYFCLYLANIDIWNLK